jgi:hypothetical protein
MKGGMNWMAFLLAPLFIPPTFHYGFYLYDYLYQHADVQRRIPLIQSGSFFNASFPLSPLARLFPFG